MPLPKPDRSPCRSLTRPGRPPTQEKELQLQDEYENRSREDEVIIATLREKLKHSEAYIKKLERVTRRSLRQPSRRSTVRHTNAPHRGAAGQAIGHGRLAIASLTSAAVGVLGCCGYNCWQLRRDHTMDLDTPPPSPERRTSVISISSHLGANALPSRQVRCKCSPDWIGLQSHLPPAVSYRLSFGQSAAQSSDSMSDMRSTGGGEEVFGPWTQELQQLHSQLMDLTTQVDEQQRALQEKETLLLRLQDLHDTFLRKYRDLEEILGATQSQLQVAEEEAKRWQLAADNQVGFSMEASLLEVELQVLRVDASTMAEEALPARTELASRETQTPAVAARLDAATWTAAEPPPVPSPLPAQLSAAHLQGQYVARFEATDTITERLFLLEREKEPLPGEAGVSHPLLAAAMREADVQLPARVARFEATDSLTQQLFLLECEKLTQGLRVTTVG